MLPFKEVQVLCQTSSRFLIANKALAGTSLPSTAQTAAAFCVELPTRVGQRDGSAGKNEGCTVRTKKCSGQLILTPVIRAYAVDSSTLRFGQAGRCDTVYDECGRPFSDVSFRAFTASPNVEKGTPTVQRFDNRSIASLLNTSTRCIYGAVSPGFTVPIFY